MNTPLRVLRAVAEDMAPTRLTPLQAERQTRILDVAQRLMARFGPESLTASDIAGALRIGTATLRWHFADLHVLLAAILTRHLDLLEAAIAAVPAGTPDCHARRRAAAETFIRTPSGTEADRLLMAELDWLAYDARDAVDAAIARIAALLGAAAPARTEKPAAQASAPPQAPTQAPAPVKHVAVKPACVPHEAPLPPPRAHLQGGPRPAASNLALAQAAARAMAGSLATPSKTLLRQT